MNHLQLWAVLAFRLAVMCPPPAPVQATASATGRVLDSTVAQSIAGARVTLVGLPNGTVTDRDGRYLLQGLAAGPVTVRVQRIGFAAAEANVTLVEGGSVTQDFTLASVATVLSEVGVTGYGTSNRGELR